MSLTNYKIVSHRSADTLASLVVAAAADGWLPLGPAQYDALNTLYIQTLVIGDIAGAAGAASDYVLPNAGTEEIGGVKEAAAVSDVAPGETDADTIVTLTAQLNTLLANLRASGTLAT